MRIRPATSGDLRALAAFASVRQASAAHHIAYLSSAAGDIAAELEDVPHWYRHTVVVTDGSGAIIGWLCAETDEEIGRVWWLGPFAVDDGWHDTADTLLGEARAGLPPGVTQEEAAGHEAHLRLAAWAERHGFRADSASVALVHRAGLDPPERPIQPLRRASHDAFMALHEREFAGAHYTGHQLIEREESMILATTDGGTLSGYVVTERQADGSLYIDFLAVEPAARGRGVGGDLVRAAVAATPDATHVHLTVRADNIGARSLYRALGFREERVVVPYRIGFDIGVDPGS